MKLYEITSEMRALDELFLSCIDEETGEVKDDGVIDILEQELQIQLQTKGAGIIKSFKNSEAMLNGVDEEIKRLQALKKSISNQINSRKEYIVRNMEMMGITKIETELGNLSLRKSKSVNIYDESLIDKKFIEIETKEKISKTEIKKAIECIWIKIAKEDIYEKNIIIFNNFRYVNISGHCFSRNNYCIKDRKNKISQRDKKCNICNGSFWNRTANYAYYCGI